MALRRLLLLRHLLLCLSLGLCCRQARALWSSSSSSSLSAAAAAAASPQRAPRCGFPSGLGTNRVVKDSVELNAILAFWSTERGPCRGSLRLKAGRTYRLTREYVFDGPYDLKLVSGGGGGAAAAATVVKASTAVRHFSFLAGAHVVLKGLRILGSAVPAARPPTFSQLCPNTAFTARPQDFGGAILLYSCPGRARSRGIFTDVEFTANQNRIGGAVAAGPWTTTMFDRCRFLHNEVHGACAFFKNRDECTGTGGGLALFDDAHVKDCVFDGNAASEGGGGLYFCARGDDTRVTVEGSQFYRNVVGFYGGGLALEDKATLSLDFLCAYGAVTVRNSEFVGNEGKGGEIFGGGVYNGVALDLECSWIVGNQALDANGISSTWGGGLYLSAYTTPSTTAVDGVVFESNSADFGDDLFVEQGSALTSLVVRSCATLQVSTATPLPACQDVSCGRTTSGPLGKLLQQQKNATAAIGGCKALCKSAAPPQQQTAASQCFYMAPSVPGPDF